jgi:hypothetical protein
MSKHGKASLEFEDSLSDTDYGLIICSKTGKLRGLWIPDGMDEDEVPKSIADICIDYFGIDPNNYSETVH